MNGAQYFLRGAALALSWLLALNLLSTILMSWMVHRLSAARQRSPAYWLALRLAPAALSLAFVIFVFIPSYWRYEPRELSESFDVTLTVLAAGALALVAGAIARGIDAWTSASRRAAAWDRLSRPIAFAGTSVPVFAVDISTPMMALAGVARPRLLITRGVLDALTDEELRAGIAHELGHLRAWDNLKRLCMRASPDLLFFTAAAATLESRWASAAEHAADQHACGDAAERCALASALVKVARLTPARTPLAEPISTLVDGGEIASRVERLLGDGAHEDHGHTRRPWPLLLAGGALGAAAYLPLLQLVHGATELLVHSLP
jgi:Zn-dependent protease with chaperone function